LVFSTIHTNDAAGGVTRLLDMGIEPYLVSSSVECFIAQRLVRLICPECRVQVVKKDEKLLKEIGMRDKENTKPIQIFEGKGCEVCKFTGYKGRTAIYEILVVNDQIRELIVRRVSANHLKKLAIQSGMKTLREDGWEKVRRGLTTVGEVLRVTQEEI